MVFVSALCWLFVVFYYCSAPLPVADTVLSTLAQLWPQQSRKCSVVAFSFVCLWSVLPPRQQSDTQSVSSSKQTVRHAPFECNCSSLSFSPAWFFPFFSGWSFLCQSRSPKGCANVFAAFLGGGNCTGTEPQYWQSTTHTQKCIHCVYYCLCLWLPGTDGQCTSEPIQVQTSVSCDQTRVFSSCALERHWLHLGLTLLLPLRRCLCACKLVAHVDTQSVCFSPIPVLSNCTSDGTIGTRDAAMCLLDESRFHFCCCWRWCCDSPMQFAN